jgi:hypothetical protein
MNVALAFANEPSEASLRSLQNFGVDYFVINKQSTTQRNWGTLGSQLYENETFIILMLRT